MTFTMTSGYPSYVINTDFQASLWSPLRFQPLKSLTKSCFRHLVTDESCPKWESPIFTAYSMNSILLFYKNMRYCCILRRNRRTSRWHRQVARTWKRGHGELCKPLSFNQRGIFVFILLAASSWGHLWCRADEIIAELRSLPFLA